MLVDDLIYVDRLFKSAEHRIARADEHRASLEAAIQAFSRREISPIPMQFDPKFTRLVEPLRSRMDRVFRNHTSEPAWSVHPEGGTFEVGGRAAFYLSLTDRDFPYRWGVILGDLVHNLRATLDNIVWGATVVTQVANRNPPPTKRPFKGRWRNVDFPIVTDPNDWPKVAKKRLWGVGPRFHALVEESQPCKSGQPTPQDAPFSILEELSNADKHSEMHFLGTKAVIEPIQIPPGTLFKPHHTWELEANTEIGHMEFLTQEGIDAYMEQVNMNFGITFEVALGKGSAAEGRSVREVVDAMREETNHFVNLARSQVDPKTGQFG